MKKLLLSSITLLLFSVSILIFDISCKKESIAQSTPTDTTPKPIGFVFYSISVNNTYEIWRCNYDGSNQTKINVTLPAGSGLGNISPSPDGKKIFFYLFMNNNTNDIWICSVDPDGTNLKMLVKTNDLNSGIAVI